MSKHTKGPWMATIDDAKAVIDTAYGGKLMKVIARLYIGKNKQDPGNHDLETPTPEDVANARLIAAAPEMLEVLITVENDLEFAGEYADQELLRRVRAVLAKVEEK